MSDKVQISLTPRNPKVKRFGASVARAMGNMSRKQIHCCSKSSCFLNSISHTGQSFRENRKASSLPPTL